MADRREHRGPHPEDHQWFAPDSLPALRRAVKDYCWLLSRGYAQPSALKVVGDHHLLSARQRVAVMRCSCSALAVRARRSHELPATAVAGRKLILDGYNVLITVEAALAGGVLLVGRDGCMRDMASMHGSWRRVQETAPAIELVGQTMERLGISEALWLLDAPVSNSGRLKTALLAAAGKCGWNWQVELVASPDARLKVTDELIATADSVILDAGPRWLNLAREVVREHVSRAWVISMGR